MLASLPFLERCGKYTVPSKQVYFPLVWSEKKSASAPELNLTSINVRYDFEKITQSTNYKGEWRIYGFGMLCINGKDFEGLVGGWPEFERWGREDGLLQQKVMKKRLKVIRKEDHGLIHLYHTKKHNK